MGAGMVIGTMIGMTVGITTGIAGDNWRKPQLQALG
jgi:hypothetical protein